MPEIRAFARPDRDQLTELVNSHVAAVVPGWSLPVSALLAQFEREPAQYVVDPWVVDRTTLVAVEQDGVVAGAHLKRYGADERVMPDYHDAAEIAWLVAWPHKRETAHALARACTHQLDAWGVARQWAGSGLPTPATFGIPDAWPHVREVIEAAGFSDPEGRTATLLAGRVADVPEPGSAPVTGLQLQREVDNLAVRFTALLDGEVVGYANIHDDLTRGGTMSRLAGWAELREHFVEPAYRRQGIGAWLLGHAVSWARLGGCSRLFAVWTSAPSHSPCSPGPGACRSAVPAAAGSAGRAIGHLCELVLEPVPSERVAGHLAGLGLVEPFVVSVEVLLLVSRRCSLPSSAMSWSTPRP